MIDGYQIYCEWCRDHNRAAPTREWWDSACAKNKPKPRQTASERDSAEIEREAREGWVDVYA